MTDPEAGYSQEEFDMMRLSDFSAWRTIPVEEQQSIIADQHPAGSPWHGTAEKRILPPYEYEQGEA